MALPSPAASTPRFAGARRSFLFRTGALAMVIVALLVWPAGPIGAQEPPPTPVRPAPPVSPGKPAAKRPGPGWLGPKSRTPVAKDAPAKPILAPRPWRRADGEASAPAALIRVEAAAARLRFEDGEEVVIPLDELRDDDRHVALREQRRADRGRPDQLPPVKGTVDGAFPDRATPPRSPSIQPPSPPLRFAAGAFEVKRRGGGDRIFRVLPGDPGTGAVLLEIREEGKRTTNPTRLVWAPLVDPTTGAVEHELPAGERVLDYHPTLELLLSMAQSPLGASALTPDVITLWDVSPRHESPSPLARFFVSLHPLSGLPWARIADEGLVVLLDRDKHVVAWDAWEQRVRYRIRQEARADALPVLGPDGRRLLIPHDAGATIVEASTGSPLTAISTDLPCSAGAFSDTDQRVALLSGGRIHVLDSSVAEDRPVVIEAPATDPLAGSLRWIDEDLIAAGNLAAVGDFIVYSVPQRRPLWEYSSETGLPPTFVPGGVFYLVAPPFSATRTSLGSVVSAGLPDAAAAGAALDPPAGPPLIAPGSAVSVYTLCGKHDGVVRSALLGIVEKNGWTYDPKSPYTLAGYLFPQKPVTVDYRTARGDRRSAEVTPTTAAIRVVTTDRLLFDKASGRFEPGLMVVQEGESPQERLDRLFPPAAGFFQSVTVPATIGGTGYAGPTGTSRLTLRGPVPAD